MQHRLRSYVWTHPEEQARAGPQRINGEYKQNKEAEKDQQVTKGMGDEAKGLTEGERIR